MPPNLTQKILYKWNDTNTKFGMEAVRTLQGLVETAVLKYPHRVAVLKSVDDLTDAGTELVSEHSLTYEQLNYRANRVAHLLLSKGVGGAYTSSGRNSQSGEDEDHIVAVCMRRCTDMIVSLLGILKSGAGYMFLDPSYPQQRIEYMIEYANPVALLTHEEHRKVLQSKKLVADSQVILLPYNSAGDGTHPLFCDFPSTNPAIYHQNHLAMTVFTSGSTGKPKGVALENRSLLNLIQWQLREFLPSTNPSHPTVTLQFAPTSFDVSFQEIFSSLSSGGTLVLVGDDIRRDTTQLIQYLSYYGIERIFLPFVALESLCEVATSQPWSLISSLRLREVMTAGEQLVITPSIVRFFNELPCKDRVLVNQYGPSESHVISSYCLSGSATAWPQLPPIGKPIANAQIYILDTNLQPCVLGAVGELYLAGVGLARGYLHNPQATSLKFISVNAFPGTHFQHGSILSRNANEEKIRLYKSGKDSKL